MKRTTGVLITLLALTGCLTFVRPDTVRSLGNENIKVAFGALDLRASAPGKGASDVGDLFMFELHKIGFSPFSVDFRGLENTERQSGQQSDPTAGLMPDHLRGIAGEQRLLFSTASPASRFLTAEEIRKVHGKTPFAYFIQGSVSESGTADLLDPEQNHLILLQVYDGNGALAGGLALPLSGIRLSDPVMLKEVCERLAGSFDRHIHKKEPAERHWYDLLLKPIFR